MDGNNQVGAVMVIGSGIAGMQASLDVAASGYKVYLVEKNTSIGGVMPQLDKTFPTNDCAMCMLAPKLVDTGRHQDIKVITKAHVEEVEGEAGHFRVRVKKHPRYIDEEKCTGCGDCAEKCPVEVVNEFDEGLGKRKAVYKLFPQANPNAFAIEKKGRSPCKLTCPAGVNVQGYVALISQGRFEEAYNLIKEKLPFPGVCGRICHHPCEDECNRGGFDQPLAIADLKRFVADYVRKNGKKPQSRDEQPASGETSEDIEERTPVEKRDEKVAIIGAGPAGLTAAQDLAMSGYQVSVFERSHEPGGMLRYGIPGYRLPKDVLMEEIKDIEELGVQIKTNTPIGSDLTLSDIKKQGYKAIFIAIGIQNGRTLNIEGADLDGVLIGVPFLKSINRGEKPQIGDKVIVIGGGNVAIDVAKSAKRLGASEVHMACLESREEMPAHEWEILEAVEEGVVLHPSKGPKRILGNGRVSGLETIDCISVFDEEGRFNPKFAENTESTLDGDTVIIAIGQASDLSLFGDGDGVETTRPGGIKVDPLTLETNVPGIFAGGDIVTGPGSAIGAVAQGHEAAISIDRYLRGLDLKEGREKEDVERAELPDTEGLEHKERQEMPTISAEKRVCNFDEFMTGFTEEMAIEEAKRCLNCGICSECLQCVEACQREAVNHDMVEEYLDLEVGSIILAAGFEKYDPKLKPEYGYGRYPNVLSSLEFERILSASGPYKGHVQRPSDGATPQKIAWIQCVGSRDRHGGKSYCSSVCCMYATKEAVIAKEHVGEELDCHIYFMDMRSFGKDFEKYYERAKNEHGVNYRRCRVSGVEEIPQTHNLKIKYETEDGKLTEEEYNMVVLSTALIPPRDLKETSEILGIELNEYGFVKTDGFSTVETTRPGIYICGASSEPKDIPETVTQASGAAAKASALLSARRGELIREKEYPKEIDVSDQEPRIGVFVCHCGINIGGVVDVPEVVEYAKTLPNVVHAEPNLYTCSQDTQQRIKEMIAEHNLNRVIVSSCTPRTHEPLFQDTIREAGLNPYLFKLANIRDQCSWVHREVPEKATEKAKDLIRMMVARSRLLKAIKPASFSLISKGLVIGGGISGLTASLALAKQGFEVYLVEREGELGGNLRHIHYTLDGGDPQKFLRKTIEEVQASELIHVYKNAEISDFSGYLGNYRSTIIPKGNGHNIEVEHGVVIVATGAQMYQPTEYLYGQDPRVITQKELEERVALGDREIADCKNIVMIQCVGSRDEERPYCSRVCCSHAIKNSLRIKELNPKANVFVLYRDIRTYGFKEGYYRKAREQGVFFIRYEPEEKPEVTLEKGELRVLVRDMILDEKLMIEPDLLVLSSGIVPEDNEAVAKLLKVPLTSDGFFLEAHAKLRPIDFSADGIFLCGLAHSPRYIEEVVTQANGAAARAATILSKDSIEARGIVVEVKDKWCSACGVCTLVCPYDAREIDEEKRVSRVIEVLCQGCGACAVTCPNGATQQKGFEKKQILSMVDMALAA